MDLFMLEGNENYDKRCGEMFFTTKGRILFHCTLCDEKYSIFNAYLAHFMDMHLPYAENLNEDEFSEDMEIEYEEVSSNEDFMPKSTDEHNDFDEKSENISIVEEYEISDLQTIESQPQKLTTHKDKGSTNISVDDKIIEIPATIREIRRSVPLKYSDKPDDRKYECPVCGARFKERHNMVHHLKRHGSKKEHQCPECEKTFYTAAEVKHHRRRTHVKERPYLCSECGLSFHGNQALIFHLKRHTGEKDVECKICHKFFYDMPGLRGHMLVHSTLRPHVCEECNASFKERKRLRSHIATFHSDKKEFACTICSASYSLKASLKAHMKVKHNSAKGQE